MITNPKNIKIEDFSYDLPEEKIAKYPLVKRDDAKLLFYSNHTIKDCHFTDLVELLPYDAVLVMNTTKVIRARLEFFRPTGARIEIFCLEPSHPALYEHSLACKREVVWNCLVGQSRKWKEDYLEKSIGNGHYLRVSRALDLSVSGSLIRFQWDSDATFGEVLEHLGELPIPPYLNRDTEESDLQDYQTVYAQEEGSVAAPTAGLHFTDELLSDIKDRGNALIPVILHVGAGTFLPVKSSTMGGHEMHTEVIEVQLQSLKALYNSIILDKPIVSVGTTTTRTLESLYYIGVQIINGLGSDAFRVNQWLPYESENKTTVGEAFKAIIDYMTGLGMDTLYGQTQIIIAPSYKYKVVDYLITNFHQPHSTLLLLVAAFVGEDWRKIYQFALSNNYRFLSYGDGSLLKRK